MGGRPERRTVVLLGAFTGQKGLMKCALFVAGLLGFILLVGPQSDFEALGWASNGPAKAYYVDSRSGDDANSGTSPATAWKTLEKVNGRTFLPGERIWLRSSSVWQGQLWPKG